MGGGVYWLESRKTQPTVVLVAPLSMFSGFQESDIQAITIARSGVEPIDLSFEAIVPPPIKPNEKLSKPVEQWLIAGKNGKESASPPSVAYLANLLATGKRDKELLAKRSNLAEFGLDQPTIVTFRLKNNQTHRLLLGKPTFNRSNLYALIDPVQIDPVQIDPVQIDPAKIDPAKSGEDLRLSLVAIELEGAVTRPLAEWKLAKPSPSVSPSDSPPSPSPPSPSPSASPSASPSPSPTQTSKPSPSASPKPSPITKP
jgi:hypothetical protein